MKTNQIFIRFFSEVPHNLITVWNNNLIKIKYPFEIINTDNVWNF